MRINGNETLGSATICCPNLDVGAIRSATAAHVQDKITTKARVEHVRTVCLLYRDPSLGGSTVLSILLNIRARFFITARNIEQRRATRAGNRHIAGGLTVIPIDVLNIPSLGIGVIGGIYLNIGAVGRRSSRDVNDTTRSSTHAQRIRAIGNLHSVSSRKRIDIRLGPRISRRLGQSPYGSILRGDSGTALKAQA